MERVPSFAHAVVTVIFLVASQIVPDGPWSFGLGIVAIVFLFMGIEEFRQEIKEKREQ